MALKPIDVIAPPTDEPLLTASPGQKAGSGAAQQWADDYTYQYFTQQFGRAPTQSELQMLSPSFLGGDPNLGNPSGLKSAIASYYQQQANSPTNLFTKQQKQLQDQAPQYGDQINQLFQSGLGRAATDAEKTHFGMLMASGQDPYQVQQALQQTPEFQQKQTTDFTNNLKGQLQSTNADYFSKYILPSIQSQNAQAGRTQDSSGYQAQLANAAQGQNYDLQNYLAQVQSSAYGNSTQNAAQNYQQLLNQQYGLQNANVSNTLSNQASNQAYNQQLNLYQIQQQAYNNYLQRYGKRNGNQGWGALAGGLIGAGAGAYVGGPAGAAQGYQTGAGLGGGIGAML